MNVICYRCGGGEAPENSIAGIEHCLRVDPSWHIEMDLQMTKDNYIVLFHNKDLKRTHDVDVLISQLDHMDLQDFKIPALVEVLESYPHQKWVLDIHSSTPRPPHELIRIIDKFGIERNCIIVSESDAIIRSVKKDRPNWKVAAGTLEAKKFVSLNKIGLARWGNMDSDILAIPEKSGGFSILSERLIRQVHARDNNVWIFGKTLKT